MKGETLIDALISLILSWVLHPWLIPPVVGFVLLVIAIIAWRYFTPLRLHLAEPFLDSDYQNLLGQLDIAVSSDFMVFPSLPIGDVLKSARFNPAFFELRVKKDRRLDFVIYHRRTMKVQCAVLLIPYNTKASASKFKVIRKLCAKADFPLIEYEMAPWRNIAELRRTIFKTCNVEDLQMMEFDEPEPQVGGIKIINKDGEVISEFEALIAEEMDSDEPAEETRIKT